MPRAIFLDRDGTLNEDPGYIHDPAQLRLFPEVGEALFLLKQAGYLLIVVSNQSAVARGWVTPEILDRIHMRLQELLQPWKVAIDHYELCLHQPSDACACRKPKPQLLFQAATRFQIDLAQSYLIGDRATDLAAGRAAGCKASLLVTTGCGEETEATLSAGEAAFIGPSLLAMAHWILTQDPG